MAISFQYLYTWIEWVEKQANKKKPYTKAEENEFGMKWTDDTSYEM